MTKRLRLNEKESTSLTVKRVTKGDHGKCGYVSHCLILLIRDYYVKLPVIETDSYFQVHYYVNIIQYISEYTVQNLQEK